MSAANGLKRALTSRLAGNTFAMACGTAGRLLLHLALFVLLARMLGPGDYGAFAAVAAVVAIVSTFAGLSCELVLVKNVARDPERYGAAFGHGLVLLLLTAPVLTAVSLLAATFLLGARVEWWMVALIALGDLLFLRINLLCAACFQAAERVAWSAVLNVGLGLCRLGAAGLAVGLEGRLDLATWALLYAASAAVAAMASLGVVVRQFGAPRWRLLPEELGFGAQASLQSTFYFTLRDIDKPLLARLTTLDATGLYAAAFRIADAAIVPIRSLMYAAYASFFRHGGAGVEGSLSFALRLLPIGLAYGVLAGIGVASAPTVVPWLLGAEYRQAGEILTILAALPFLHAAYNIGADALTACGLQAARSLAQGAAAASMLALCLVLTPRYGASGAAIANVASHAVLAILVWGLLAWHRRSAPTVAQMRPAE